MAPPEEPAPVAAQAPRKRKKKGQGQKDRSVGAEALGTAELEAIVFGSAFRAEQGTATKGDEAASAAEAGVASSGPKKKKRKGARKGDGPQEALPEVEDEEEVPAAASGQSQAAWADPDDAVLQVDISRRGRLKTRDDDKMVKGEEYERRLREHFVRVHGSARWADKAAVVAAASDEDTDDEGLVPTSAKVTLGSDETIGIGPLKPRVLHISRRKDIVLVPGEKKGPAAIRALQFHPSSELMLTAGFDKRLRFFMVDGEENPKVSSHFFRKFPITEASFTPDGDQVLLTGETKIPSLKVWSLDVRTGVPSGVRPPSSRVHENYFGLAVGPNPTAMPGLKSSKFYSLLADSEVIVCDVATKHPIRTLRMSAPGVASAFSKTRDTLWTADQECNLYEWDLGSGRCLQKTKESWANGIKSLAVSEEGLYGPKSILAVGTTSGNVDLYDASLPKLSKEPYSSIDNLTTGIDVVRFHHSGELLACASREKRDALKLVHAGTGSVFETWPTHKTPLGKVCAFDFSRRAGLVAIGNEQGRVLLYQLTHFERQAAR